MSAFDLYRQADDFLVQRANDAVKAWNWTTGRTRADLATAVTIAGYIASFAVVNGMNSNKFIGMGGAIMYPLIDDLKPIQKYHRIDRMDKESEEKGLKQIASELMKNELRIKSQVRIASSGLFGLLTHAMTNMFDSYYAGISTQILGITVSSYIMRADHQTPRKDCVRRGIEALKEMHAQSTALQLSPISHYELTPIG